MFTHKGKACILLVSMQGGGKGGGDGRWVRCVGGRRILPRGFEARGWVGVKTAETSIDSTGEGFSARSRALRRWGVVMGVGTSK